MKITLDLDTDLYRAIKVEAARSDRSVREVVAEALEGWLEATEEAEDRASAAVALAEYEQAGGTSADQAFAHIAAETRATYGDDAPTDDDAPRS
jgi:plasmid stability protein